tara:strand:- start:119 stop:1057 length:939 start_codon:yes stop_codon:yes gene_type:complete
MYKHNIEKTKLESELRSKNSLLLKRVTYASVFVACLLIVVKFVAWVGTDSVSILSSLADSFLDGIASIINLIAVRHALSPADQDHRFGHGKAEALSGLAQSTFIIGSVVFLLVEVVPRFFNPQSIENGSLGIGTSIFALVITVGLVIYQKYVIRKTNSLAISADSLHYVSDILLNVSVIVALVLSIYLNWILADVIFAVLIAFFILFSAAKIFRRSYDQLMDKEFPENERDLIKDIVLKHPDVLDIHDLRTRKSGYTNFIQFHLDLKSDISLYEAHEISDQVEMQLLKIFPGSDVIIHQDPEGVDEFRAGFE